MQFKLTLLAAAAFATGTAALASGDPFEGRWLTDDGKAIVTVDHCGTSICGRVSRVLDRGPGVPATDIMNPDRRLKGRPILGLPVLYGFRFQGGRWTGGTAYDPKSGSSYNASVTSENNGSLRITGCVLFLCRSKHWTRTP